MITLEINPDFASQRSSTAAGFTAVGDMTQEELIELAIQAVRSHDSLLLQCFITLPSLADLQAAKVALQQGTIESPATTPAPVVSHPIAKVSKPVKTKEQIQEEMKEATDTLSEDEGLLNSLPE